MKGSDYQYRNPKAKIPVWNSFADYIEIRKKHTVEEIFKNGDLQWRHKGEREWKDCLAYTDIEYRFKPKDNLDADIEALQQKAKELGMKLTILTE